MWGKWTYKRIDIVHTCFHTSNNKKNFQRERRVPLKHESNLPVFMCPSWKDLNCCHICSANRTRWDKELFSKKAYSSSIWQKMCNRSPRQSLVNKVARTLAAFNHQFKISKEYSSKGSVTKMFEPFHLPEKILQNFVKSPLYLLFRVEPLWTQHLSLKMGCC